ncbi:hypothetical protein EPO15_16350 [bacterium]|nr:MAG: hypothetical protein EPO15_16350 [bacterium]
MAFHTGRTVEPTREPALAKSAAPRVVEELLAEVLAQSKRRAEVEAFIKSVHDKALRTAGRALERDEDAQDALAETYAKLLAGKTEPRHFFRSLNQTIIDRIRARRREARLEDLETGDEPCSGRLDDQDPLDILIHREDEEERQRMLAAARRDPRWRYIKHRTWAAPLRKKCAESAPSNA